VHKVIKGWSNFWAAWFTDIKLLEEVYRATRDSAGIVHAIEVPAIHESGSISTGRKRSLSIPNLTNDHYGIVMQPVGLRGADATPKDEAQLARAAHGCLYGLEALHKVTLWVCVCAVCCMPLTSAARSLAVNSFLNSFTSLCDTHRALMQTLLCDMQHTMHPCLCPIHTTLTECSIPTVNLK